MRPATRLNDFCKRGVAAARKRKADRERRETLVAQGVTDASTLLPTDYGDAVMDVHMLCF